MEMKVKRFGVKTLITVALIFLVLGVAVTTRFDLIEHTGAQNFWKESVKKAEVPSGPPSFVELAKNLMPAVVNISTTQVMKGRPFVPFPEFKNPFEEFFGEIG